MKCMCPLQLLPTLRSLSRAMLHLGILLWVAHIGQVYRQSFPRSCLLFGAKPKARKPVVEPWESPALCLGKKKTNPCGVEEEGGVEGEAWLL